MNQECTLHIYPKWYGTHFQMPQLGNLPVSQPSVHEDGMCHWLVQLGEEIVAIPEPLRRSARFNDGKASPAGSLIVGTVHNQATQGQPGQLFLLAGGPHGPFDLVQVRAHNHSFSASTGRKALHHGSCRSLRLALLVI